MFQRVNISSSPESQADGTPQSPPAPASTPPRSTNANLYKNQIRACYFPFSPDQLCDKHLECLDYHTCRELIRKPDINRFTKGLAYALLANAPPTTPHAYIALAYALRAVKIWKQLEAEGFMGAADVLDIVERILRRVEEREVDEYGFYAEDFAQRQEREKIEGPDRGQAVFALRGEIDEGLLVQPLS